MRIQLEIQYPWVFTCKRFSIVEISFDWVDNFTIVARLLGIGIVIKIGWFNTLEE